MTTPAPVRVLLVEDHPADITLTRKAFTLLPFPAQLDVVLDGVEAMQFLRKQGRHTQAQRPHLILLDLNMPRMDGREVLREVASDPALRTIPIVVLTTSSSPTDVSAAYGLCANAYHAKPVGFDEFQQTIAAIATYWFQTALIPR